MFNWLKRQKTVRLLVVVDNDSSIPVDYCNKIDVPMTTEVRAACNALAIPATAEQISVIGDTLRNGETYWFEKTWGFQVLTANA